MCRSERRRCEADEKRKNDGVREREHARGWTPTGARRSLAAVGRAGGVGAAGLEAKRAVGEDERLAGEAAQVGGLESLGEADFFGGFVRVEPSCGCDEDETPVRVGGVLREPAAHDAAGAGRF